MFAMLPAKTACRACEKLTTSCKTGIVVDWNRPDNMAKILGLRDSVQAACQ